MPTKTKKTSRKTSAPTARGLQNAAITSTTGAAQPLFASNPDRQVFMFQNISDTDMWLNFTGTASAGAGSFKIKPDVYFENPAGVPLIGAVSLFCSVSGKAFTAKSDRI